MTIAKKLSFLGHTPMERRAKKVFLVFNDIDPPRICDLEKIVRLCKTIDGGFSPIEIECQKINPYGVASRYPDEITVNETIVKTLVERAQKVYSKVWFNTPEDLWSALCSAEAHDFCVSKVPVS